MLRTLRVREPLSYYISFYVWGIQKMRSEKAVLGDNFVRWVNETPNLQSSVLLHPSATQEAIRWPYTPVGRSRLFVQENDGVLERLREMLRLIDVVAPLERFDAMLLVVAELLGLRHVQHARIDPMCQTGRPARARLDIAQSCDSFADTAERCKLQVKACAPHLRAACEEAVRRAAPLDRWLYRTAVAAFETRMQTTPGLDARVRIFTNATVGVWRGGPPARPQCIFERTLPGGHWAMPNFEHDPCTPAPQGVGEAAYQDRAFIKSGRIVPFVRNAA